MAINITEVTYGEFGKCIKIDNGIVDVFVTVEVGPRIIRYGFVDERNIFNETPEKATAESGWKPLGGHRLWHSPEHAVRTYERDDKPVKWERLDDSLHVIQPIENWSQMGKELVITMAEDSTIVHIQHRITNMNAWPIKFAVWPITVMAPGGKEVIPTPISDAGLLPNRSLGLWSYSKMTDSRVWWGDEYITLKQDPNIEEAFKVGITGEDEWAAYFNDGYCFIKRYLIEEEEEYPDNGMTYETYTNGEMLEMETLSPLYEVDSGEFIDHEEIWELFSGVEAPENSTEAIDEAMMKIFESSALQVEYDHGCDCGEDHDCDCGDDCTCDDEGGCNCH